MSIDIETLLQDNGGGITHHFGGGVYAKETVIPAGLCLEQHVHDFEHLSILASGTVAVFRQDRLLPEVLTGPACVTVAAGVKHAVVARTDAVWYCIHATEETDAAKVDNVILGAA